ncbi:MAG: isoprenylcysteine carboxylmethyltransferase family protein [Planctomycetaceae bacterium]|nr:isoprenylcysteine carboxylmethyltransferase family protein [Planctomycetaceae bacterium]
MNVSRILRDLNHVSPRWLVSVYLSLQAMSISLWWGVLLLWPDTVYWFHPSVWPADSFWAFGLSDGILLVGGSLFVLWSVVTERDFASLGLWALAAAAWYPTLYCLGASCLTNEGWLATAMMFAMSGATLAMATIQGSPAQAPATYRVTPMTPKTALIWTLLQVVLFWGAFLIIFPLGFREVERKLAIPHFEFSGQIAFSLCTLISASCLGLASGIAMATLGRGTPLPSAAAPQLVCRGPYRWIRNPMALAGILQGIGVGLFLGSYLVVAYALCGAVFWHVIVRPSEESDLLQRFGSEYNEYRSRTGLWLPGCWRYRKPR